MPPSTPLSLDSPAIHLDVSPGGEIILRGAYELAGLGTIIDAATLTQPGLGPVPGGLIDLENGGFHLTSRNPETHEVHLIATGDPGQACAAAGVASPCLPVRAQKLAVNQLMTLAEWRKLAKGGINIEVVNAPVYAPPPAAIPYLAIAGSVLAIGVVGAFLVRRRSKQARSPAGQLLALARQVQDKLARADAVLAAPLAPAVAAALKSLREQRVDAGSTEGKRIAAILQRVDTRLDDSMKRARENLEQQAADELVQEFEAALEAADEATLASLHVDERAPR